MYAHGQWFVTYHSTVDNVKNTLHREIRRVNVIFHLQFRMDGQLFALLVIFHPRVRPDY